MYLTKSETVERILRMLCEGNSIRGIQRMTGVHRDTIMRLMSRAGHSALRFLDDSIVDLPLRHIQVDECWTYVQKRNKQTSREEYQETNHGNQFVFVALDDDTRLVVDFLVGRRNDETAHQFIDSICNRVRRPFSLSSDGYSAYSGYFVANNSNRVDYNRICVDEGVTYIKPSCSRKETNHVERFNLTLRSGIRRMARANSSFSKTKENLEYHIGLFVFYYNFIRPHLSFSGQTPAMMAEICSEPMDWKFLVDSASALSPKMRIE